MQEKQKYEKRKKEFYDIDIPDLLKMVADTTTEINIIKDRVDTLAEGSTELSDALSRIDELLYKRRRIYRRLRRLGHGLKAKKDNEPIN